MSVEVEVERVVQYALQWHGRIDVLVNNAARFVFSTATEVTEDGELGMPMTANSLWLPYLWCTWMAK